MCTLLVCRATPSVPLHTSLPGARQGPLMAVKCSVLVLAAADPMTIPWMYQNDRAPQPVVATAALAWHCGCMAGAAPLGCSHQVLTPAWELITVCMKETLHILKSQLHNPVLQTHGGSEEDAALSAAWRRITRCAAPETGRAATNGRAEERLLLSTDPGVLLVSCMVLLLGRSLPPPVKVTNEMILLQRLWKLIELIYRIEWAMA